MKIIELFDPKLKLHPILNPKLWEKQDEDYVLRSEVKAGLKRITAKFQESLKLPTGALKDVVLTGSNVNYNWTKLSDLDVHLHVELDQPECPRMEDCLQAEKALWNSRHDVKIHGVPVEMYVTEQEVTEVGSAGTYSLQRDEWIKKPSREQVEWDQTAVVEKSQDLAQQIDDLISSKADQEALQEVADKLWTMRKSGLEKGGEYSVENLVFKSLRNNGYVEKIKQQLRRAEDESLSVK